MYQYVIPILVSYHQIPNYQLRPHLVISSYSVIKFIYSIKTRIYGISRSTFLYANTLYWLSATSVAAGSFPFPFKSTTLSRFLNRSLLQSQHPKRLLFSDYFMISHIIMAFRPLINILFFREQTY